MNDEETSEPSGSIPESEMRDAIAEMNRVRKNWLRRPGVTAIDVGFERKGAQKTGALAVRVHVKRKLPESAILAQDRFPEYLGRFPVDVVEAEYGPQAGATE